MLNNKKPTDKIQYRNLNELIKLSRNFMRLLYYVSILAFIVLITYIFKEWKLFQIVISILGIIVPLFIGIVIAWLFDPIVTMLQKKGVKRILGAALVYVVFLGGGLIVCNLMMPALTSQIREIVTQAPATIENLRSSVDNILVNIANDYDLSLEVLESETYSVFDTILHSVTTDVPATVFKILKIVVDSGLNIFFGLFIGFYMLLDFNSVREHLLTFLPKRHHQDTITLTDRLNKMLKNYVQGTLLVMLCLFICQSIGLSIAGMKAPLVFGLFCAVTNIIPYFGPYIGGIPAVVVGFTISPSVGLGCLISVLVCQLIESYFLTPTIMSKTMKLHPVTIIMGLLLFGHFFGILGMILATPVISCCKVIIQFFDEKYEIMERIN